MFINNLHKQCIKAMLSNNANNIYEKFYNGESMEG